MAQLADYVAAERDGALLIACYTSARIAGERLDVTMETSYPWDGDVRLTVGRAPEEPYGLVLRVPGWARGATVTVNGEPHPTPVEGEADGWLSIERRWAAGDEVRLTLPMPVRAHGSHPHLDATRGALGLARGPLVYCVEQQDSPSAAVDDLVVGVADVAGAKAGRREEAVVLDVTAGAAPPPSEELYPELPLERAATTETAVTATFVPYFLWGNRGPEAMRVWVRTRTTDGKKAT